MKRNKYYRLLQAGDKYDSSGKFFIEFGGTFKPINCNGGPISYTPHNGIEGDCVILEEVNATDSWIDQSAQPVQREDFEPFGYIDTLYEYGGELKFKWALADSHFPDSFKYWRRITPPVPQQEPIKVGEHNVQFVGDGSIKVGCQVVSNELFEKISNRRAKVINSECKKL